MNTINRPGRCDRCGVPAKFQVILPNGDLLLCGHHEKQHQAALVDRYPVMPIARAS